MTFANPNYFISIWLLIFAIVVFFFWVMRARRKRMEAFSDKSLLEGIAPFASTTRKVIKLLLIMAAFSLMLFSLARPQWGFVWEEVKRSGLDILVAQDVSKSMLATDVRPNRLERSKFAIRDLIKKLNGDRIGLIAFAGSSFLQCPLTIDYNGFLLTLDDLNTASIPRGGTSITSAIKEAIQTFSGPEKKFKVLVIITDGEDLEGDALVAAKEASDNGIKIYCVGVGSIEGELIPVSGDRGEREYLSDKSGNVVKSKLNEDLLKRIAIATGGSYVHATQSEFGLTLLYDMSISKLEKRDIDSKMRKHYEERFQIFLAIAIFILLLEPFIAERKRFIR